MPGNTKAIVKDVNGQAAPQYFNPVTDAYEYATGANGALNVQLTGRKVESIVVVNALAIVDTTTKWYTNIDISKYADWVVWVKNTHNQSVDLKIDIGGIGSPKVGTDTTLKNTFNIVAGDHRILTANSINLIGLPFAQKIAIGLTASVAPTSGSISVEIWGVPN